MKKIIGAMHDKSNEPTRSNSFGIHVLMLLEWRWSKLREITKECYGSARRRIMSETFRTSTWLALMPHARILCFPGRDLVSSQ